MKILLIHGDVFPWATTFRAEEFKRRWKEDDVDIKFYEEVADMSFSSYGAVHVLFSGGMSGLERKFDKYQDKMYLSVASLRTLEGVYDRKNVLKKMFQGAVATVAQNPRLKELTQELVGEEFAHKIHYIPNGVDTEVFNNEFIVGFVGNRQSGANDHKGYELVKRACNELGVKFKSLKDTYQECRLPHHMMPDFYRTISCLVIPSASEGCNNPTLEALAMNIPVITTDTGIARELPVILIDRTVESIKNAISKLHTRSEILKKYTWDNIAQQYRALYEMGK